MSKKWSRFSQIEANRVYRMLKQQEVFSINESLNKSANETITVYTIAIDYLIEEVILFFGVITVSINICVFYKLRNKDTTYKFLLAEAIADLLYLALLAFSIFVYCGTPCQGISTSFLGDLAFLILCFITI